MKGFFKLKLYQKIIQTRKALEACEKAGNIKAYNSHCETLQGIHKNYLPSGSGFDGQITIEEATDKKLVIRFDWHILNDNGYYDGWLDLLLIVTPNLSSDFDMKIKWYTNGNDKRKVEKYKPLIEDFLYDEWYYVLTQEIN